MSKISVAVDLGESLTKVIYRLGSRKMDWIAMHSGLARMSLQDLKLFLSSVGVLGVTNIDDRLWIKTKAQGIVGLGKMTKNFVNLRQSKKPKYEDAVAKILAVIARLINLHDLAPKGNKVDLGVLLPYDEKGNHGLLREFLAHELANYEFCGDSYVVELNSLKINSEGSGLSLIQGRKEGVEWIAQRKLGVVMLGHRNTSAVYFNRGELVKAQSPLVGFEGIINQIELMNPGVEAESLTKALWKVFLADKEHFQSKKYPSWGKFISIQNLATAHSSILRKKEVKQLAQSINLALKQQEEKLEYLFEDIFPHDLDAVIIGGGSAALLKNFLQKYFSNSKRQTVVIWNYEIAKEVKSKLSLGEFSDMVLAERYVDLFGYFTAINA